MLGWSVLRSRGKGNAAGYKASTVQGDLLRGSNASSHVNSIQWPVTYTIKKKHRTIGNSVLLFVPFEYLGMNGSEIVQFIWIGWVVAVVHLIGCYRVRMSGFSGTSWSASSTSTSSFLTLDQLSHKTYNLFLLHVCKSSSSGCSRRSSSGGGYAVVPYARPHLAPPSKWIEARLWPSS